MTRTLKITALALLGVVFLWACGGGETGPKEIGESFLKAIKKGDFSGAKSYGTTATNEGLDKLEGNPMAEGLKGNPDDIKVGEFTEDGDKGSLAYTDGGKDKKLKMEKVDGKWKVNWSKMDDTMDMGGDDSGDTGSTDTDTDMDTDTGSDMDGGEDMDGEGDDHEEHEEGDGHGH